MRVVGVGVGGASEEGEGGVRGVGVDLEEEGEGWIGSLAGGEEGRWEGDGALLVEVTKRKKKSSVGEPE